MWEPGQVAVQRSPEAVHESLVEFIRSEPRWVIEGCYGELVELAAAQCTRLVFLNPGLEACLANNRGRPWEPHKHTSKAEQDAMLETLQAWVAGYYERDDDWSYAAHRRIFDAHQGAKEELTVLAGTPDRTSAAEASTRAAGR